MSEVPLHARGGANQPSLANTRIPSPRSPDSKGNGLKMGYLCLPTVLPKVGREGLGPVFFLGALRSTGGNTVGMTTSFSVHYPMRAWQRCKLPGVGRHRIGGESSQCKSNYFTEMCSGSEEGSYLWLIDFCITQL
jgi:hypothetical protein